MFRSANKYHNKCSTCYNILAMRNERRQSYINCPSTKNINEHFRDQLEQLSINPANEEERRELIIILNQYLNYPDGEIANNHRLANKLGLLDINASLRNELAENKGMSEDIRETKIFKLSHQNCQCCGFLVQPNDLDVCSSAIKDVKNVGVANRVFFQTFCYLSFLLSVMVIVYSLFAFSTNIAVAKSTNYLNNTQNIDYLSISLGAKSRQTVTINNDGQKYYYVSAWLGVALMLLWAFIYGCIRKQISGIEYNAQRKLRISDFSIVIENMPTDFTKEDIQRNFDDFLKEKLDQDLGKEINVRRIEVVKYNQGKPFYLDENQFQDTDLKNLLKEHQILKKQIASYVVQYRKYGRFQTNTNQRTYSYMKFKEVQIGKRKKQQQILAKMRKKMEAKFDANRTVAFVTFATYEQKEFIINNNKNSLFYKLKRFAQFWKDTDYFTLKKGECKYDDIIIETPSEPEDIQWGNLGLTNCQKFLRMCLTLLVSLILVGISLVIVYGLSTVQKNNQNQRFISILISLAISITNLLIIKVIQFMTVYEKFYSTNNYQISIAIKSVLVQLINSVAVPILVNFYLKDANVFGRSGLIEDIFVLSIASSFVPPLVRLIDPWNLLLILRLKYYSDEERRLYLNQFELNSICQRMQFEIGLEYIYLIHNFIFVCFFVSLQPIIPLFSLIALFLMYWIEKYSLYSRCQRPVPGPDTITSKLYQLIFFGAVAFALGNLTWSWFLPDKGFRNALTPNLITLGISLIIFIFPYEKLVKIEVMRQDKDYYEKKIYFPSEYDRLNPSTARQAIQEYRQFLYKKKAEMERGSQELQNQIIKGLQNSSRNNFYKPNYLNILSANDQDLAIQKIFYNQSTNVISPNLLLQELMSQRTLTDCLPKSDPSLNPYPDLQGANSLPSRSRQHINKIDRSVFYHEPTSKQMLTDPRAENLRPSADPRDIFQGDIDNMYRSNIKLDGFNVKSRVIKRTDSQIVPEDKKTDPK